ncbi:hypothetical protein FHX74_003248 [Friedmanniella endophytica]|uniref:UPF0182 protein FHX74_003248 n=1 Tax=Microlunatus kandeliicorticis TaxID=1759536 RepID=A0A7W3P751_9ACTN|nr:UPF0182 family protein [Microlunatus kandeliicorticis]MBA8795612.1 hypothetical protein [Microlunatus kandeliicorticis]
MSTLRMPRRRGAILPTLIIVAVLIVAFAIYTGVWTDRLWYVSMGFGSVFSKLLATRIGLFAASGLLMAAAVYGAAALAFRTRPRGRPVGPTSPALERYREALESRFMVIMIAVAVLVGLFAGGAGLGRATLYLAWINSTPFGTKDPKYGLDISFFVFDYPWWRFVLSYAFTLFVLAALVSAIVHYVVGNVRFSGPRRGASGAAQAQLSVIIGLAVLVKGVGYWFDQYGLEIADAPRFTGMGYTADHATSNAKIILAVIAGLCALLFFANAALRRWMVPTISLVLLLLAAIVLGIVYPAAVQGLSVRPDEPDKERPYIGWNIAATRAAYGVDKVAIQNYSAETTATAGQLQSDAEALPGVRLIDPAVVAPAYEQLQQVRGYYAFPSVLDVDRYPIDGSTVDTVVAARELDPDNIANKSWNNLHTVYTHGYGLVAAYGNRRQSDGEPDWIPTGSGSGSAIVTDQPRIYFGELLDSLGYSVVGARPNGQSLELDNPSNDNQLYTYTGQGGVPLSSLWRRILYAVKFTDGNLLLSDRVNDQSRIIYDRSPKERVQKAAPWLTVDRDSYPAVVDGRLVWIVDGYTTSNSYPNSQRVSLQDATSDTQSAAGTIGQQLDTKINYMRNSVKAVVDAYDGTVKLYQWDTNDPVLKTWEKAFPGTVLPRSEISPDLLAHFRYPQDLFKVQRSILARYHVTDPNSWYLNSDLWKVPLDPVSGTSTDQLESPYYLSVKWPDDDAANFSLTGVFVPNARNNLAAYMAVNADASSPEYGQMRILRMSDSTQIDGPQQSFNAMINSNQVAETLRPFLNQGSNQTGVKYGNLLTLPVGGGLLYVQPVYTQREGTGGGQYPVLQFVMARFGQSVGIGQTLQAALDQVFAGDSGANTGEGGSTGSSNGGSTGNSGGGGSTGNATVDKELAAAQASYAAAEKALRDGDLAGYQQNIKEMADHITAAQKAEKK